MPVRSTTRWFLEPSLPWSVGFGLVCSPPFGAHGEAVHTGPIPVDGGLLPQLVQEPFVQLRPDADLLPVVQPAPAGRAAAAAQLRWQHLPGTPVLRTTTMSVRAAWSETRGQPPFGLGGSLGKERFSGFHRSSETSTSCFVNRMMPRPPGSETSSKDPEGSRRRECVRRSTPTGTLAGSSHASWMVRGAAPR